MNRLLAIIYRSLTTIIAPMVYINMAVSVFIGFAFITGAFVGNHESVLYDTGVIIEPHLWGTILMVAAVSALIGFATNKRRTVMYGAMVAFMAWLFASLSLFAGRHWYVLISVALFHLLFQGYVYLAAALGALWRHAIEDDKRMIQ